jgi:hypothetical protein
MINILKPMTSYAIEFDEQLPAMIQPGRLGHVFSVTGSATALRELRRQNRLLPGERAGSDICLAEGALPDLFQLQPICLCLPDNQGQR